MITEIATTIEILNGLKSLISSTNTEKEKEVQLRELLFRNYYSEIIFNKKLFETINFQSGLNQDWLSTIKEISPLLKNDYGKAIVASLGKFKEDIKQIENQSDSEDKNDTREKTLVSSIIYTVNRIELLKQLSQLNSFRYMKKLNITTRLKNIKRDTDRLCKAFNESFEDVINKIII